MNQALENLDVRQAAEVTTVVNRLGERLEEIRKCFLFAKLLRDFVENNDCDLESDGYSFAINWNQDGIVVGRKLLPVVRSIVDSCIKEDFSVARGEHTVAVYALVEGGHYKGMKIGYETPAPQNGKCVVEEVTTPEYTSFKLVCKNS
jgi:hypothetical protein